jgi:hypothetical protein
MLRYMGLRVKRYGPQVMRAVDPWNGMIVVRTCLKRATDQTAMTTPRLAIPIPA